MTFHFSIYTVRLTGTQPRSLIYAPLTGAVVQKGQRCVLPTQTGWAVTPRIVTLALRGGGRARLLQRTAPSLDTVSEVRRLLSPMSLHPHWGARQCGAPGVTEGAGLPSRSSALLARCPSTGRMPSRMPGSTPSASKV